jgi:UDP-N-acetylglucosamine 2-epimerase (non-hydrolysing)
MTDVLLPVGTRPNFVKAASLVDALDDAGLDYVLLHTGQHYDARLSHVFFRDLDLPEPQIALDVGSGTHAEQTARAMLGFERELLRVDPALVVVVGDVNSTLACALAAVKAGYPVAHVEAGLRSFDERMPEEINRRLTDHISRYLFTTSADADANLRDEGIDGDRVELVGNTMVDTLLRRLDDARSRRPERRFGLAPHTYAVATLHRPENVDDPIVLSRLVAALAGVARLLPVVLPLHPRTRARLAENGLAHAHPSLLATEPLGYLDFLGLVAASALVLTDSGGLQEETTTLGIPCLTLRESTERPVTVDHGSNIVVGTDPIRIVGAARRRLELRGDPPPLPPLWDGLAGRRIVARLRADIVGEAVLERSA